MRAFCALGGILLTNDLQFLQTSPIFANQNLTGEFALFSAQPIAERGVFYAQKMQQFAAGFGADHRTVYRLPGQCKE
jgi:hypothetical protein